MTLGRAVKRGHVHASLGSWLLRLHRISSPHVNGIAFDVDRHPNERGFGGCPVHDPIVALPTHVGLGAQDTNAQQPREIVRARSAPTAPAPSSGANPPSRCRTKRLPALHTDSMVIWFVVMVPVLSRPITWIAPSVSTASSLRSRSSRARNRQTPAASVVVATVGRPSGTAATASEIAALRISATRYARSTR
jgi:hypothetical protein